MRQFLKTLWLSLAFLAASSMPFAAFDASAETVLERFAGTYEIVPSQTKAQFFVGQVGGPGIRGEFSQFSGVIDINRDDITSSRVDVQLRTAGMTTGNSNQDAFIKSRTVFHVERHPVGTFKSTKVTQTGDITARVEGHLTLKGISHPVTLFVSLLNAGNQSETANFAVQGMFQRGLFGMGIGVPIYKNVVELNITATANRRS